MSRVIDADFAQFNSYLSNYSLALPLQNALYVAAVKKAHRRFFAALTFSAEIEQQAQGMPKSAKRHAMTVEYFKESVSDLGSALFNMCHGARKPARIMMRSALETTAKGLAASASLMTLKKKSVFSVVEDAKKISSVKACLPAQYFARLEHLYADLCKDVHTATSANMAHITAMGSFPNSLPAESTSLADLFVEVSGVVLTLQIAHFPKYYHQMHFRNAPVVRAGLKVEAVQFFAGAET